MGVTGSVKRCDLSFRLCDLTWCTQEYEDGSVFHGQCRRGVFFGRGRMRWANGDSYEGLYEHGLMHGQGVYKHADGTRFAGQFTENIRDGYGVCTFPDGSLYEGQWEKDRPEGEGRIVYPHGEVVSTFFKDGLQQMEYDPKSKARQPMIAVKAFEKPSDLEKTASPQTMSPQQRSPALPALPPLPALSRLPLEAPVDPYGSDPKVRLPVAGAGGAALPAPIADETRIALPELQPLKPSRPGGPLPLPPPPPPPLPKGRPPAPPRGYAPPPRSQNLGG